MRARSSKAFTLIELLAILAVVAIIAALLLPRIAREHVRPSRVNCLNNVKQVWLAFGTWANEHGDKFPMQISTNGGGTMELAQGPYAFAHFQAISNELASPVILLCPEDSSRKSTTSFGALLNTNISYFVGVDASLTNELTFLSGDRNLTNGTPVKGGILELTTNQPAGWTPELHVVQGNIAFADGKVEQLSTSGLRQTIGLTGMATNRLAMP